MHTAFHFTCAVQYFPEQNVLDLLMLPTASRLANCTLADGNSELSQGEEGRKEGKEDASSDERAYMKEEEREEREGGGRKRVATDKCAAGYCCCCCC